MSAPFPEVLRGAREMGAPGAVAEKGKQSPLAQAALSIRRRRLREIDNALPRFPRTPAEVNVLEEEEEPRIEGADLLKERPADEEARPHRPIDVAGRLRILVPLEVPPHASGKRAAQDRPLDEEVGHAGKRAVGIPHRAVFMEKSRREDADGRICLHRRHHVRETGELQCIVRIDDEEIFSSCARECERIPSGITHIPRGLENVNRWKPCKPVADDADGVVAGMVINNQHLQAPHPPFRA